MLPLISIVTPCYNAEKTISETIDSVLSQTYQNWEMLIIDDCSNDKSKEIINNYVLKDSRIKYKSTSKPSGSPSLPRNIGIDSAQGVYIAFLDSDDLWLSDKLEKQIRFIENNKYEFVYSDYEKVNYKGCRNNRVIKMPNTSSYWDVLESCTIPCLTAIIARRLIGHHRFKSIPKEDFAFWLEILKQGTTAHNQGEVLALYREQPVSRSSNKIKMVKNQWFVLREIEGIKPVIATILMMTFLFRGLLKFLR